MRLLPLILLASLSAISAESPAQAYPLWDGQESIAEYAKRAGLEPTKTLHLGDGVKLDLALIPAGKFTMGIVDPPPVVEESHRSKILTGQVILGGGGGAFLILLCVVLTRAIRNRQRPQYSLAWFLVMTVAVGIGLLGGLHWHYSAKALAEARSEYEMALALFASARELEKPAHEVTLTQAFYIGKYEVTQEQYRQIMGINPSGYKGRDLPVECVSWYDAQEFCRKASEQTDSVVRLPTEAEWEHACRAGTKTGYYTGIAEADLDRAGWYDKNGNGETHPVGQKTPNSWGLHDMYGNVWEWCSDWYEQYKQDAVVDPRGPAKGVRCVLRGGSWDDDFVRCRSTARFTDLPSYRFGHYFGFRVAVSIPKSR